MRYMRWIILGLLLWGAFLGIRYAVDHRVEHKNVAVVWDLGCDSYGRCWHTHRVQHWKNGILIEDWSE